MSLLLKLLMRRVGIAFAYLLPCVEGEGDPDPESDPNDPDDGSIDPDPEDDPVDDPDDGTAEAPNPETAKPVSRSQRDIIALRERSQKLERELEELRTSQRPANQSIVERQREQEDRQLADPNVSEADKWAIRANRTLQETQQQSGAALARAADDRDAAAYDRKSVTNPLFEKYRDRVEKLVADERKAGRLVQREQVLTFLIGQDMLVGNLKSTKAAVKTNPVPRGKPVGARSDIPRKGGTTEHQKRISRLQDQII